jgi:hypothetical protein
MTQIIIEIGPLKRALTERDDKIGAGRQVAHEAAARAEQEQRDFSRRTLEADAVLGQVVSAMEFELGVDIGNNLARSPHKWTGPVSDGQGHQVLTYEILNAIPPEDRVKAGGFFADKIEIANGVIRLTGGKDYQVNAGGGIEWVPCGVTFEAFKGAGVPKTITYSAPKALDNPEAANGFAELLVRSTVSVPSGAGAGARVIKVPTASMALHRA